MEKNQLKLISQLFYNSKKAYDKYLLNKKYDIEQYVNSYCSAELTELNEIFQHKFAYYNMHEYGGYIIYTEYIKLLPLTNDIFLIGKGIHFFTEDSDENCDDGLIFQEIQLNLKVIVDNISKGSDYSFNFIDKDKVKAIIKEYSETYTHFIDKYDQ